MRHWLFKVSYCSTIIQTYITCTVEPFSLFRVQCFVDLFIKKPVKVMIENV